MTYPPTVKFEKKDHIGVVTINRPEQMNSLDMDMLLGIEGAMMEVQEDDDLWIGVLTASAIAIAFLADLTLAPALVSRVNWAKRVKERDYALDREAARYFCETTVKYSADSEEADQLYKVYQRNSRNLKDKGAMLSRSDIEAIRASAEHR